MNDMFVCICVLYADIFMLPLISTYGESSPIPVRGVSEPGTVYRVHEAQTDQDHHNLLGN